MSVYSEGNARGSSGRRDPTSKPKKVAYGDSGPAIGGIRERNPMRRFFLAGGSRKAAIDAMCAHCLGCSIDSVEPGYQAAIKHCRSEACPLWRFRPYRLMEVRS